MIFKIDHNVPFDTTRYVRWPFASMSIGDSFFTELDAKRVSGAASHYAKKHTGFKFACRQVTENNRHGVRVWRVRK